MVVFSNYSGNPGRRVPGNKPCSNKNENHKRETVYFFLPSRYFLMYVYNLYFMIYEKIQKHFTENVEGNVILFRSSVSGSKLWGLYMQGFGEDPIYRDPSSSVHNCNCCRNFIERYGNIISVDLETREIRCLWEVSGLSDAEASEYGKSFELMSKALKEAPIGDVFAETYDFLNSVPYEKCNKHQEVYRLGIEKNLKMYTEEEARKFGVVQP